LEQEVIKQTHEDPLRGHPGTTRTVEAIQREYYFPGLYRKVKKYVNSCELCKKSKHSYQKPQGKMQIDQEQPIRPWKDISIDFVEMPEIEKEGQIKNGLLVVVDRFSKQTVLIPSRKEANTEETYELLWERIFSIFGIPDRITSDRDKILKTEKWERLMEEIGAKQNLATSNHQQTDGQTERKVQEMQVYYRIYSEYDFQNWIKITPRAQYALNDAMSSSTRETPNFIVFGLEHDDKKKTNEQNRMTTIHKQVEREIEWSSLQQKRFYDRGRVESPTLKRGDRVYLKRRNIGNKRFNIKTKRN
jgi:hypothetical protein